LEEYRLRAALALVGNELEVRRRVCITIRNGIIEAIETAASCSEGYIGGDSIVLLPQPANAHIHTADLIKPEYAIKEGIEEAVAPPKGLKHRLLAEADDDSIVSAILKALRYSWRMGVGLVVDFREGGARGCRLGRKALKLAPEGLDVLLLGRPQEGEPTGCDGLGLSSPLDYPIAYLKRLVASMRPAMAHVAETRDARERGDLETAMELGMDAVIHGVYLDREDYEAMADRGMGMVACVRSNMWHGLGTPDLVQAIDSGVTVALGTDNAGLTAPNPWREAEAALLSMRLRGARGEGLAHEVLKSLMINGYRIVGKQPRVIEEGAEARMVVFNAADTGILIARDSYHALVKRLDSGLILARIDGDDIAWL